VEEWGEGVGNKGSQLSSVCSSPYLSGLVVRGAAILWWVGNFVGEVIGVAWYSKAFPWAAGPQWVLRSCRDALQVEHSQGQKHETRQHAVIFPHVYSGIMRFQAVCELKMLH